MRAEAGTGPSCAPGVLLRDEALCDELPVLLLQQGLELS
jgi:hypothetical protein